MSGKARKNYQQVEPGNRRAWRQWLSKNHKQKESVWLVLAKKNTDLPYLSMSEAVEEALCFGWIDSVANKCDEKRFKVLFAPRKSNSQWSAINKSRVKKLTRQRLMTRAGLKVIEQAKQNGTWNALNKIEKLQYPPELKAAFHKNKRAEKNFQTFPPSAKKAILHWIISARRPDTLQKRIGETIAAARKKLRVNEWRQNKS